MFYWRPPHLLLSGQIARFKHGFSLRPHRPMAGGWLLSSMFPGLWHRQRPGGEKLSVWLGTGGLPQNLRANDSAKWLNAEGCKWGSSVSRGWHQPHLLCQEPGEWLEEATYNAWGPRSTAEASSGDCRTVYPEDSSSPFKNFTDGKQLKKGNHQDLKRKYACPWSLSKCT